MVYLRKITTVLLLSLLSSACGANLSIGLSEPDTNSSIGKRITGTAITTENEEIDLGNLKEKDTFILIFAQDTCTTCSAEATEISERIEELGKLPDNVEIITFLVGLTGRFALQDAIDWKEIHKVQWNVTFKNGDEDIFKNYFPGSVQVPAILIQKNDEIFFQHVGALGIEELERLTGEWK